MLTEKFTCVEIDAAVDSCDGTKAPGPDGYNFNFIKSAWDVIKKDVYEIVFEFWRTARLPKGSNNAFIAMIPKVDNPLGLKDYRPISMVGCVYKIISKILARRLQRVISELIGPSQSSFIHGRQILDGALIASELIESCRRNKTQAIIFKLDFHKAFDNVSWSFLDWVLQQMHFPPKWRQWINSCVMSASASILVNGSPTPPFKLQRGLRQGDPLSPFLFDIIVESLNLLIQKSIASSLWEGIKVGANGISISNLQYADDTILFCPPKLDQLLNIKRVLLLNHQASGLRVNFHKSSILGIHIQEQQLNSLASSLLCKTAKFPFTYLGLPIGGNMSRIEMWNPIIESLNKKLASWKGNLLSIGGRLTLIKASLSSLPIYYMSLFPIPKGVAQKIIAIQRQFLWRGCNGKQGFPLVSWKTLELPKPLGGLNIGNIHHRNMGLMFKWIFRFFSESNSLWQEVIKAKYAYGPGLTIAELPAPSQGGPWRAIVSTITQHPITSSWLRTKVRKKIGNGESTLFWHDIWVGDQPLKNKCPRLFLLSPFPNATISSFGLWDGLGWQWCWTWRRTLRPRDETEFRDMMNLLERVVLSPNNEDSLTWMPHKAGDFSVKSFTIEMTKNSTNNNNRVLQGLWRGLIPHRIELFIWFALLGRINTKVKLISMGILPPHDSICILCDQEPESSDHLLLHCQFSWQIWTWWIEIWGLNMAIPPTLKDLFVQWSSPLKGNFFRKVWQAMFSIITWSIWKEHNARIFSSTSSSITGVKEMIMLRLSWWIKGWGDPFPYSHNDMMQNPRCLAWAEAHGGVAVVQHAHKILHWSPPPLNTLKWNVDASFQTDHGNAAIGGVLRDHKGNFLCIFSAPIPEMEINSAEVLAIHRAIRISKGCTRFIAHQFIVESDSSNAVRWCSKNMGGPWNLNFFLNYIRNAQNSEPRFIIEHKKRESNMIADALAKQGLRRLDEFIAWI